MKKVLLAFVIFISIFTLAGCKEEELVTEYTVTDREGNEVVISKNITRIVSTAPSNTEIIVGLGLADKIVAVDKYSPTTELNEDITIINFRNPDVEVLIALQPDIIIASGHNKVGDEDPFILLKEAGIAVVYLPTAETLDGILDDITFMGLILNEVEKAQTMRDTLETEIDNIRTISSQIVDKLDVYFEIGDYSGTLYSVGSNTFLDEIITLVGGNNIYHSESGWPNVSVEDIITKNPDVIITNQSNAENAVDNILNRTGFSSINAVINNSVFLVNGNTTSRGSQNIIEGIKEVAEALYPDIYDFE